MQHGSHMSVVNGTMLAAPNVGGTMNVEMNVAEKVSEVPQSTAEIQPHGTVTSLSLGTSILTNPSLSVTQSPKENTPLTTAPAAPTTTTTTTTASTTVTKKMAKKPGKKQGQRKMGDGPISRRNNSPTYDETSQDGDSGVVVEEPPRRAGAGKKGKKKKDKNKNMDNDFQSMNRRLPTNTNMRDNNTMTRPKKSKKKGSSYNDNNNNHSNGSSGGRGAGHSAYQTAVADMMRNALEEDQYSNIGSVVETDSSDDEDDYRNIVVVSGGGVAANNNSANAAGAGNGLNGGDNRTHTIRLDRSMLLHNMRKRTVMEGRRSTMISGNVVEVNAKKRAAVVMEEPGETTAPMEGSNASMAGAGVETVDGELDKGSVGGRGKKKKRKKGKKGGAVRNAEVNDQVSGNVHDANAAKGGEACRVISDTGDEEDDLRALYGDESSVFGQTTGSTNSTWIQCDKCGKWRRLRGVVDVKKLPSKWYCSMNKKDPDRAKCSAPEEEYDAAPNTPESATDQRTRKHLRLWVRRLQCNEAYEARLPTMTRGKRRNNATSAKEPYEWVRCCNPSCGKWRALLRSMDSSSVIEAARNGEWYCVLNTWDEKTASCAAPQENLPAIGCPLWVQNDEKVSVDRLFDWKNE